MNLAQLRFAINSTSTVSDSDCSTMLNELEEELTPEVFWKILSWLYFRRPVLHFIVLNNYEEALQPPELYDYGDTEAIIFI